MTCRHSPGDPNCSSQSNPNTPDKAHYEVVQFERVGLHVVMKVLYPNCSRCSYEGNKILVFLNVTENDLLKWSVIDPHFREPEALRPSREAPGPAARFPASKEGWADAVEYAKRKCGEGRALRNDIRPDL